MARFLKKCQTVEGGANAMLAGQPLGDLVKRDVPVLFDHGQDLGRIGVEFGTGRMTLLARLGRPSLAPQPEPVAGRRYRNAKPLGRLPVGQATLNRIQQPVPEDRSRKLSPQPLPKANQEFSESRPGLKGILKTILRSSNRL